jgi:hypothetical protein
LPLFDAPFVAVGLVALARRWRRRSSQWLLGWLILFPVPASLTFPEVPHEIRAAPAYPLLDVIAALGLALTLGYLWRLAARIPSRTTPWRALRAAPFVCAALLAANAGVGLMWLFAIAPGRYGESDWRLRRGLGEALAYFRQAPPPDTIWIPSTTATFFPVLYFAGTRVPPEAAQRGDVPRFLAEAPPRGTPPPHAAWISAQQSAPDVDGWSLRRLVLHPDGSMLWAVYTGADLPPGDPLVVRQRMDGGTPVDAIVLSVVVLAAALVVCRGAAGRTMPVGRGQR